MKKILILAQSCNQELFYKQEQLLRTLYVKDILDNKYPNIDFWFYTASYDTKYHVSKQEHKLYIPADDSLEGTFEKTNKCFKLINSLKWDYDFILRTNCSTYINVELLNNFINTTNIDPNKIYCGSIYLTDNATGPYNWLFYGVGNALLLSKKWINVIIKQDLKHIKNYVNNKLEPYYKIDDNTIGLIINNYAFENKMNIYDIWQSFKFPNINNIPDNPETYIIIPFREYNLENTRNNEYNNALFIHNKIKNTDISKIPVNNMLNNQVIHILDFERKMHSIVSRNWVYEFLSVMSLPKYIEKLINKY